MREALAPMFLKPLLPAARCTYRFRATKACSLTKSEAGGVLRSLTRGRRLAWQKLLRRAARRFPARRFRRTDGACYVVIFAVGG